MSVLSCLSSSVSLGTAGWDHRTWLLGAFCCCSVREYWMHSDAIPNHMSSPAGSVADLFVPPLVRNGRPTGGVRVRFLERTTCMYILLSQARLLDGSSMNHEHCDINSFQCCTAWRERYWKKHGTPQEHLIISLSQALRGPSRTR